MISMPEIPSGSNVVGLGIDTIEVSRIRDSIENHGDHFLNKIFTAEEKIIPEIKQILLLFMPPVLRPRKRYLKRYLIKKGCFGRILKPLMTSLVVLIFVYLRGFSCDIQIFRSKSLCRILSLRQLRFVRFPKFFPCSYFVLSVLITLIVPYDQRVYSVYI